MNAAAKATYTSGPWVFSGGDSAPILHIYAPDNKHVFHKDRSLEEMEANARLMAAAPDLLRAARNCITPLEWARDNIDPLFAEKVQANINSILAAISKAESAQ